MMNGLLLYRFNYKTTSQGLRSRLGFKDTFTCRPQGPWIKSTTFRSLERLVHPPEAPQGSHNWQWNFNRHAAGLLLRVLLSRVMTCSWWGHILYISSPKQCTISLYSQTLMERWALLDCHLFCQVELLEWNIRSKTSICADTQGH